MRAHTLESPLCSFRCKFFEYFPPTLPLYATAMHHILSIKIVCYVHSLRLFSLSLHKKGARSCESNRNADENKREVKRKTEMKFSLRPSVDVVCCAKRACRAA